MDWKGLSAATSLLAMAISLSSMHPFFIGVASIAALIDYVLVGKSFKESDADWHTIGYYAQMANGHLALYAEEYATAARHFAQAMRFAHRHANMHNVEHAPTAFGAYAYDK
jgi:hypothetical protein